SLHGSYPTSSLLRTHPPPSRLRSTSRFGRLYDLPCSGDFAPGRGGLRQFLGMSLSPCCRFHPAEMGVPRRSDFGIPCCLHPTVAGSALGSLHFRGHVCVPCRYGPVTRSLPEGDLVDGLQDFGILDTSSSCHPTTGLLTLALAGLPPAEHTSLYWTQQPCMNLSIHTAPDVRPLPWHKTQWAKRCGFARRNRANQSRAPLVRWRIRLNLRRAHRMT